MPYNYGMKGIAGEASFVPKRVMVMRTGKQPMFPNEKMVLGVVRDVATNNNRLENKK